MPTATSPKATAQPFTIAIPQTDLDDLQVRLDEVRWPAPSPEAGWTRGTDQATLTNVVDYWRDGFDWRAQEAALNQLPQFTATINGIDLHFIHQRGTGPNPMPLLLLHGWPDSFYRFVKVLPLLTDPGRFGGDPSQAFDVIIPSLPGFGFSSAPAAPLFTTMESAAVMIALMTEVLGYDRFGAAGGDGGSPLAQAIALAAPERVTGIQITDLGWHNALPETPDDLTPAEQQYLADLGANWMAGGGYIAVQSTRPQTLAYGLNDSPTALAGWILDKFHAWSDHDGDLLSAYSRDELVTNLAIYWFTQSIGSSIQTYYEGMRGAALEPGQRFDVPVGMAVFPKDTPPPREYAARLLGRLDGWVEMPRGGHFTAWEAPAPYADALRAFFQPPR